MGANGAKHVHAPEQGNHRIGPQACKRQCVRVRVCVAQPFASNWLLHRSCRTPRAPASSITGVDSVSVS